MLSRKRVLQPNRQPLRTALTAQLRGYKAIASAGNTGLSSCAGGHGMTKRRHIGAPRRPSGIEPYVGGWRPERDHK